MKFHKLSFGFRITIEEEKTVLLYKSEHEKTENDNFCPLLKNT